MAGPPCDRGLAQNYKANEPWRFQLAAWERGIGMIWRSNDWVYDPVFRDAIGVKPGEKIVATTMIGYPAHVPEKRERTDVREKLMVIDK